MSHKPRLTVGSLRGVPQGGRGGPAPSMRAGFPTLPPAKQGKGCCRKMCAGCPWAEQMRQALRAEPPAWPTATLAPPPSPS